MRMRRNPAELDSDLPPTHVRVLDPADNPSAGDGDVHHPPVGASPSSAQIAERQPRERAVQCRVCRKWTTNYDCVCDLHSNVPAPSGAKVPASHPVPGTSPARERQPRERMVPCQRCGFDARSGKPRTMTADLDADCGAHPTSRPGRTPVPVCRPAPGATVRGGW